MNNLKTGLRSVRNALVRLFLAFKKRTHVVVLPEKTEAVSRLACFQDAVVEKGLHGSAR